MKYEVNTPCASGGQESTKMNLVLCAVLSRVNSICMVLTFPVKSHSVHNRNKMGKLVLEEHRAIWKLPAPLAT